MCGQITALLELELQLLGMCNSWPRWRADSSLKPCLFENSFRLMRHSKKYATQKRNDRRGCGRQRQAAAALRLAAYRCG